MKYQILHIFSFLTLSIPGSIKSTKPRFFPSSISLASLAILVFVIYDLGVLIQDRFFSSSSDPESDNVEVIDLSAALFNIILRTTNILVRCLSWFFFPRAQAVYAQLQAREKPRWEEWTANELALVFLIFTSIGIEQIEVLVPEVSKFALPEWTKEGEFGITTLIGMCCSYFGSFASLDFLSLFFLSFVALFTKELERLAETPEPQHSRPTSGLESSNGGSREPIGLSISSNPIMRNWSGKSGEAEEQSKDIEEMVEGFLSLGLVWDDAEEVTGLTVLIYFFVKTASVAVLSFFCLSSATDLGLKSGKTMIFFLSTLVMIGKMVCLGNGAHALIRANRKLVSRVEKAAGALFTSSSVDNFYPGFQKRFPDLHADNLVLYMRENPRLISALQFFILSRTTLTSILGLVITFLVVLVQFKVAT